MEGRTTYDGEKNLVLLHTQVKTFYLTALHQLLVCEPPNISIVISQPESGMFIHQLGYADGTCCTDCDDIRVMMRCVRCVFVRMRCVQVVMRCVHVVVRSNT